METRVAAKIIVPMGNISYLFTEGSSGRLNLPGGGLNYGESPRDAAIREFYEETNFELPVRALKPLKVLSNLSLSSSHGEPIRADWHVFEVNRHEPGMTLDHLEAGNEVTQLHELDSAQIRAKESGVTETSKVALEHYIRRKNLHIRRTPRLSSRFL